MDRQKLYRPLVFAFFCFFLSSMSQAETQDTKALNKLLDDFHQAASNANYEAYFNHFSNDAYFLGTDASERWSMDEFKAYSKPHFDKGKGWTYIPLERNLGQDGKLAWFDEILDNKSLGLCRGTGVLKKTKDGWKLKHYSLTLLIPNPIAREVGAMSIAQSQKDQASKEAKSKKTPTNKKATDE